MSFTSIMGIREDTNLKGQEYSWLTTCIYIAILIVEYPINRVSPPPQPSLARISSSFPGNPWSKKTKTIANPKTPRLLISSSKSSLSANS